MIGLTQIITLLILVLFFTNILFISHYISSSFPNSKAISSSNSESSVSISVDSSAPASIDVDSVTTNTASTAVLSSGSGKGKKSENLDERFNVVNDLSEKKKKKHRLRANYDVDYLWKSPSSSCESEFVSRDGGQSWDEVNVKTEEVKFRFKLFDFTPPKFEDKILKYWKLGILDKDRGVEVALTPYSSLYRFVNKDEKTKPFIPLTLSEVSDNEEKERNGWFELCSGTWNIVEGQKTDVEELEKSVWNGLNIDPKKRPPPANHKKEETNTASVLLQIASYRDPLCGNTLMEAFQHAAHPDRVFAAVVQQIDPSDPDCIEDYCSRDKNCRRNQIRIQTVPLEKSRGVMPGRFRQHLLIKDEVFCFQVDSHSVFPDRWDLIAIEDWFSANNEMAIMTTYPNKAGDRYSQKYSPARCSSVFSGDKQVVHDGNSAHNIEHGDHPILVPFFGAGISFGKCHANLNVPYDPYMGFLFGGEEFNRGARLWTWGYDLYAPRKNYAYHFYDSEDVKPEWARKPRNRAFASTTAVSAPIFTQTVARWRVIFGQKPKDPVHPIKEAAKDIELFGIGCRRSLKDFQQFAGIDLESATLEDRCQYLGTLPWVAWDWEKEAVPIVKNGKEELRFHPSGAKCASLPTNNDRRCITTMDLIREDAEKMLDLTNSELLDSFQKIPNQEVFTVPSSGIISPHCREAYLATINNK